MPPLLNALPRPAFVYFDLDDTLLDHRHAEQQAWRDLVATYPEAFQPHALSAVQATYRQENRRLWRAYASGTVDRATLQLDRFAHTLAALHIKSLDPAEVGAAYMRHYATHWTLQEGAADLFHWVAERRPVGLLTNGFAEVQHAKLDRFPFLRAQAQAVIISEEVGYLKPDQRLFAHATAQTGVDASAILYVGDSFTSDVEGGLGAGWQVAWYTPDGAAASQALPEGAPAYRFSTWATLRAHLGRPRV
ncbi:MAG: HAD-IA family hydrolase [Bacteroidota bacterium]